MQSEGFNTLVLHRNDFIDLIVYPGKYFGCEDRIYKSIFERYTQIFMKLYKYTPTRRSGPYQRRAFFKRVLEQAKRRNIQVYIENKELYFPEIILEFYPNLLKNGKVCANDPFWWEFTRVKFREFFEEFPEVSGIITAPATGESKISITSNRCTCELCQNTTKGMWFENLLSAMYEPIHAAGKKLIVRDFVFDSSTHKEIASVMERLPEDVVISLKNTPHDYYPTFPENNRIGKVGNHAQWVEFDTMGQYFGWGIGIADLLEDYRKRMASAKKKGVSGVLFRTDWESLDGHTTFRTQNIINLYSAPALALDLKIESLQIYHRFLEREGWFAENADDLEKDEACQWFASISSQTWEVTRLTPFVNDCVFSDSSLMPVSLDHAFWLAEEKNSLRDWVPGKQDVLYPKKENVEYGLAEKDEALRRIQTLNKKSMEGCSGLNPEKLQLFQQRLFVNEKYVSLYRDVTRALLLTRYVLHTDEDSTSGFYQKAIVDVNHSVSHLKVLCEELRIFHETTDFSPHTVYTLLDPDRVICLYEDLSGRLKEKGFFQDVANDEY